MCLAIERQHVVFAEREKVDVLDDDHLRVVFTEECLAQHLVGVLLVATRKHLHGFGYAGRRLQQSFALRVLTQQLEDVFVVSSQFCFLIHSELIGDRNFSFHDSSLGIAHIAQADQHLMGLLVGAVVAYTTYPARRIEMYIDGHVGELCADAVARSLCLLAVSTRIAAGKGLYTIAIDLVALHNLLRIVDRHVGGV